MVLYVSVIEIAELFSLPEDHFSDGHVSGPVGGALLAIIWGTAVGLAIAHWFAFRVAAPGFRGERPSKHDAQVGLAQVGAAMFVAAVSSIPVVFFSDVRAQETVGYVPALVIGIIAFLVARASGKGRTPAVFYGATAAVLGVLVAIVKSILAAH